MQRYNIGIELRFNNSKHIKITKADNGEWIRYEDALALEAAEECAKYHQEKSAVLTIEVSDLHTELDRCHKRDTDLKESLRQLHDAVMNDSGAEPSVSVLARAIEEAKTYL